MPAEAEALLLAEISREGHTATAGAAELWFPYVPIMEPSTIMFALWF